MDIEKLREKKMGSVAGRKTKNDSRKSSLGFSFYFFIKKGKWIVSVI